MNRKDAEMRGIRSVMVVGAVLLVTLFLGVKAGFCAVACSDLPGMISDPGLMVPLSAEVRPAAGGMPEYCEVRGTLTPEIKFAVKLPTGWNERFYMVGGGGFNGAINDGAMTPAVARGYVTTGTDSGHDGQKETLGTFAYNPPNNSNPNALQKKLDFAYRSYYDTAVLAKKIIKAYVQKSVSLNEEVLGDWI